jgi:hypothetical protein
MTLDRRKFKKINFKVDCFWLAFFLQAEARVLMQWNVICIFLDESLTIAYCQNALLSITMESMLGQLKQLFSILSKFISLWCILMFFPYFCFIWSSKYNSQGLLPSKYQTCFICIIIVIFIQLNPPKGYV